MIGAILGDIVGSRFEWHNTKRKDFEWLTKASRFTDDSVMTVAIASAIMKAKESGADLGEVAVKEMQKFGCAHFDAGYGGHFCEWLGDPDPQPYNSWGNGAAMRVSAVGWAAETEEEVREMSAAVTEVTHNHPEGLKGAEATAMCVFLARKGKSKDEIKKYVEENYYKLDFTLDQIRPTYEFDVSCQGTVPQAIVAFLEADSYEDAIRNAVSIGGDSDTLAAIAGGIAEAFFGMTDEQIASAKSRLPPDLLEVVERFEIIKKGKVMNTSEKNCTATSDADVGKLTEVWVLIDEDVSEMETSRTVYADRDKAKAEMEKLVERYARLNKVSPDEIERDDDNHARVGKDWLSLLKYPVHY